MISTIASSLKNHLYIGRLYLYGSQLSYIAAASIAAFIKNNFGLKELYLNFKQVDTEGGIEILRALQMNSGVKIFSLSGFKESSNIEDEITKEILQLLEKNFNLTSLENLPIKEEFAETINASDLDGNKFYVLTADL